MPERRSEKIEVRVTPLEKALVQERALEAGQKVSDYVRDRALCRPPSNEGAEPEPARTTCGLCGIAKFHPHEPCPACGKLDRPPVGDV